MVSEEKRRRELFATRHLRGSCGARAISMENLVMPRVRMIAALAIATLSVGAVLAAEPDDLGAAGECAAASRQTVTQNVGGGVYTAKAQVATPVTIELPSGVDARSYAHCLDLHGLRKDVSRDHYLAVVEKCRAGQPPERHLIIGNDGRRHVVMATDRNAIEACVRKSLGHIEVEVQDPR